MADTKIGMKIEEEIKPLKELCEKLVKMATAELDQNPQAVDTHEMYEVMDMIKDLAEAKKDTVEACYKMTIAEAMEENADEYGETWDENGRKFYRGRSKTTGRYIKRYNEPEYYMPMNRRDMDMVDGRMYYTDDMMHQEANSRDYKEGKTGMMRKNYIENKALHKTNSVEDVNSNMGKLEMWIKSFVTDVKDKEVWDKMSQSEKNLTKQILQGAINEM